MRLRFAARPDRGARRCSLRRWRPLPLAVLALALAVAWNVSPLVCSFTPQLERPVGGARLLGAGRPLPAPLALGPTYRVEVVGTADHWEAVYLPQAGIPIVRGWFRQDDFPQNEVLYDKLTRALVPGAGSGSSAFATSCSPTRRPTTARRHEIALLAERALGAAGRVPLGRLRRSTRFPRRTRSSPGPAIRRSRR